MADSVAARTEEEVATRLVVRGLVQGVGFRPNVLRLAKKYEIVGSVMNSGSGVEIVVRAPKEVLETFITSIYDEAPPLARIDSIERSNCIVPAEQRGFRIADSKESEIQTGVLADAGICSACTRETFDPCARRFRYPFTNCTHCGPRLSIIQKLPYDRASTTMAAFEMCPDCRAEYDDADDRRFHAQPVACHKCGPRAWLERADGLPFAADVYPMLDDVDAVCTLIQHGFIVAIKGLGGFQLACDASNEAAVSRLRSRKHRERKPFALMARDIDIVGSFCEVTAEEQELLESPSAPIVILTRKEDNSIGETANFRFPVCDPRKGIAGSVAPGINTLGVMLPSTPLHHLLLGSMDRPIVLTSGNISDEPQCIENDEAKRRLGHVAQYFLMNDRPIAQRVDDSVVKTMAGEVRVLRRARGYAPEPFVLPGGFEQTPAILAFGSELKNTFCLFRNGSAIVSQHIGDLEDPATQTDYLHNLGLYTGLYQHQPRLLACDLHPEYISSKLARVRAERSDSILIETQHHHAHIASVMVENRLAIDAGPVMGVALDGLGYGEDGTFWGGEFLRADYRSYKRLGTFKPVAMIGGEKAIKEPWRNTYAHVMAEMGWAKFAMNYSDLELFEFLNATPRTTLDAMIRNGINSPPASSCGRLFDAVAAAAGIAREHAAYEGQGAVEFEAIVDHDTLENEDEILAYPFSIPRLKGSNLPYIEPLAMWQALLGDLILATPIPVVAARFHKGLAKVIVQMIEKLSGYETGEEPVRTVALSGGVWQNKVLLEQVVRRLEELEFTVLTHREFPANDGGLSLGQAVIAAARYGK